MNLQSAIKQATNEATGGETYRVAVEHINQTVDLTTQGATDGATFGDTYRVTRDTIYWITDDSVDEALKWPLI